MTLKQIAALAKKLTAFLALFADCLVRRAARELLAVYVKGQLSELHRKTAEAIALEFGKPPRTLATPSALQLSIFPRLPYVGD